MTITTDASELECAIQQNKLTRHPEYYLMLNIIPPINVDCHLFPRHS